MYWYLQEYFCKSSTCVPLLCWFAAGWNTRWPRHSHPSLAQCSFYHIHYEHLLADRLNRIQHCCPFVLKGQMVYILVDSLHVTCLWRLVGRYTGNVSSSRRHTVRLVCCRWFATTHERSRLVASSCAQ